MAVKINVPMIIRGVVTEEKGQPILDVVADGDGRVGVR